MSALILCFGLLFLTISSTEAGECCRAYTDIAGNYHPVQWCPNYCCRTALLGYLSCCDNAALQAPADERLGFCELWWKNHVWAAILLGVGSLAILVACCVCCYRCCCRRSSHTTIIQSARSSVSVTSVNTTSVSNVGYNRF